MCLIAYAPKCRTQVPEQYLRNAYNRNHDAWGIMYPRGDGRVVMVKDTTGFDKFLEAWSEVPEATPCVAHFRYATAGARDVSMAHPFPVLTLEEHGEDLSIMHNGVLSVVSEDKELSDSAVLIRDIIKPHLVASPAILDNGLWCDLMERLIANNDDTPNKLVFMKGSGDVYILNRHQGFEEDGVWYSNEYSVKPTNTYGYDHSTGGGRFRYDDEWGDPYNGFGYAGHVSPHVQKEAKEVSEEAAPMGYAAELIRRWNNVFGEPINSVRMDDSPSPLMQEDVREDEPEIRRNGKVIEYNEDGYLTIPPIHELLELDFKELNTLVEEADPYDIASLIWDLMYEG